MLRNTKSLEGNRSRERESNYITREKTDPSPEMDNNNFSESGSNESGMNISYQEKSSFNALENMEEEELIQ